MAKSVLETERKYDVDEDTTLPRWSGVAGVQSAVGPEEQLLEATCFDTPDIEAVAQCLRRMERRRWNIVLAGR